MTAAVAFICCGPGCCPGCQHCYGMGMGCHQEPCRCELPCACRWKDEDDDPTWRNGCERHNAETDTRNWEPDEFIDVDEDELATMAPCPVCGAQTACGYDDEGRALIHAYHDEDEDPIVTPA